MYVLDIKRETRAAHVLKWPFSFGWVAVSHLGQAALWRGARVQPAHCPLGADSPLRAGGRKTSHLWIRQHQPCNDRVITCCLEKNDRSGLGFVADCNCSFPWGREKNISSIISKKISQEILNEPAALAGTRRTPLVAMWVKRCAYHSSICLTTPQQPYRSVTLLGGCYGDDGTMAFPMVFWVTAKI